MERLTDKNIVGMYFYPKCFEKCDGLGGQVANVITVRL